MKNHKNISEILIDFGQSRPPVSFFFVILVAVFSFSTSNKNSDLLKDWQTTKIPCWLYFMSF